MTRFPKASVVHSLLGATLLLAAACGDEEPATDDGGDNGGTSTGGTATGGTATGGSAGAATGGSATGGSAGTPATGGAAGSPATGGAGGAAPGGAGGAAGGPGGAGGAAGAAGAPGGSGGAPGGSGGAPGGSGGAPGGSGGMPGGSGGAGGAPPGAQARYSFETASNTARDGAASSDMGWQESMDYPNVTVAQSTMAHAGTTGTGSLRMAISMQGGGGMGGAGGAAAGSGGAAGAGGAPVVNAQYYMKDADPPLVPGQTINFSVRVPAGAVNYMNLVIEDVNYSWTTYTVPIPATRDMFATATFTVPVSVVPPIRGVGFQVSVAGDFGGDFYIDEMSWGP